MGTVGAFVGLLVGTVGCSVGAAVGVAVGETVGANVPKSDCVGAAVGAGEGAGVGEAVGAADGCGVGDVVGVDVGVSVSASIKFSASCATTAKQPEVQLRSMLQGAGTRTLTVQDAVAFATHIPAPISRSSELLSRNLSLKLKLRNKRCQVHCRFIFKPCALTSYRTHHPHTRTRGRTLLCVAQLRYEHQR